MTKPQALTRARIVRIVVASPGDVQPERDAVTAIAEELNRDIAADRNMVLRVVRWETDAFPGFHPEGPQGLVDTVLRIEESDLLIGIFWRRFGTPVKGAGSGTEHEIMTAFSSWQKRGTPQLMIYFNQKEYTPKSKAEREQWERVRTFQANFPKEGLWWSYKGKKELGELVRTHLTRWILRTVSSKRGAASRSGKRVLPEEKVKSTGRVSGIKLSTRKAQLSALKEDHRVANRQLARTVNAVERNRLRREIGDLESEMASIENEILELGGK